MLGLFQALGPCRILPDGVGTRHLEYTWTRNASMIFLDQPAGVGFSESDRVIGTLAEGAGDFERFLEIFLDAFPVLKGRELHIAGESYAGHYIPQYVAWILERERVNVTSVILGNAFVDYASAFDGYMDILCSDDLDLGDEEVGNVSLPILSRDKCVVLEEEVQECIHLEKLCSKIKDRKSAKAKELCKAAEKFCTTNITLPNTTSSVLKSCPSPPICYPDASWIQTYLNSDPIKKALSIPSGFKYAIYDPTIDSAFTENGDTALSTYLTSLRS
ncbi:alpha/beta-hydrolase [Wilcoxina mikolae CBS 423.85]|nr:alpha/beta-hydrolase [Wilcoxina mikolae CBS 423.85]